VLRRYARRLVTPRWLDREADGGPTAYQVPSLINPDFAKAHGLEAAFREHDELRQINSPTVRDVQKATLASDVFARTQEIAEHYAAACGLDIRHPYMDVRVLEYCVSIPSDQSLSDGWTRHIMRRAMESTVPSSIAWRADKTDFGAAFQHGLMNLDRNLVESILMRQSNMNYILNCDEMREMWGDGVSVDDSTAAKLSQLATLSYWSQRRTRLKGDKAGSPRETVRKL
jgi:asparagine synthase (glutamine-hydrolysing)